MNKISFHCRSRKIQFEWFGPFQNFFRGFGGKVGQHSCLHLGNLNNWPKLLVNAVTGPTRSSANAAILLLHFKHYLGRLCPLPKLLPTKSQPLTRSASLWNSDQDGLWLRSALNLQNFPGKNFVVKFPCLLVCRRQAFPVFVTKRRQICRPKVVFLSRTGLEIFQRTAYFCLPDHQNMEAAVSFLLQSAWLQ